MQEDTTGQNEMTDAELHAAIQQVRVEIRKAQAQGDLQLVQKHQDELKRLNDERARRLLIDKKPKELDRPFLFP